MGLEDGYEDGYRLVRHILIKNAPLSQPLRWSLSTKSQPTARKPELRRYSSGQTPHDYISKEAKFSRYGNIFLSTTGFSDLENWRIRSSMQLSTLGRYLGRLSPDLETAFERAFARTQTNKHSSFAHARLLKIPTYYEQSSLLVNILCLFNYTLCSLCLF